MGQSETNRCFTKCVIPFVILNTTRSSQYKLHRAGIGEVPFPPVEVHLETHLLETGGRTQTPSIPGPPLTAAPGTLPPQPRCRRPLPTPSPCSDDRPRPSCSASRALSSHLPNGPRTSGTASPAPGPHLGAAALAAACSPPRTDGPAKRDTESG